jgi:hypothetical protein
MEKTFVNPQRDYFVSKAYDLSTLQNSLSDSARALLAQDPYYRSMVGGSSEAVVNSSSFLKQAQNLGSHLAHQVLDGVADLISDRPRTLQVIKDATEHLSECIFQTPKYSEKFPQEPGPVEIFEGRVASGHQIIDKVYDTAQADFYTPENKELREASDPFSYGVLPPPGRLAGGRPLNVGAIQGRLAPTMANSTWGWKVGEPINNKTWWGGTPKWSAVRALHWKNQAEWAKSNPGHEYGNNIPRMEKGLAPQRVNDFTGQIERMELHHIPPQRDGGRFDFIELWPNEHASADSYRKIRKK